MLQHFIFYTFLVPSVPLFYEWPYEMPQYIF